MKDEVKPKRLDPSRTPLSRRPPARLFCRPRGLPTRAVLDSGRRAGSPTVADLVCR